jgi:hypothetical protein
MEVCLREARIGLAAWRYGLRGKYNGVFQVASQAVSVYTEGVHQSRGQLIAWLPRRKEMPARCRLLWRMAEGWALDFPCVQIKCSGVPEHYRVDRKGLPLLPFWVEYYSFYECPPRWYEWERDLRLLLKLLAQDEDASIKPVEVSVDQLRKLMAAGSDGSSLRFTAEGTVRRPERASE